MDVKSVRATFLELSTIRVVTWSAASATANVLLRDVTVISACRRLLDFLRVATAVHFAIVTLAARWTIIVMSSLDSANVERTCRDVDAMSHDRITLYRVYITSTKLKALIQCAREDRRLA